MRGGAVPLGSELRGHRTTKLLKVQRFTNREGCVWKEPVSCIGKIGEGTRSLTEGPLKGREADAP